MRINLDRVNYIPGMYSEVSAILNLLMLVAGKLTIIGGKRSQSVQKRSFA
jgi:hypothetical protein